MRSLVLLLSTGAVLLLLWFVWRGSSPSPGPGDRTAPPLANSSAADSASPGDLTVPIPSGDPGAPRDSRSVVRRGRLDDSGPHRVRGRVLRHDGKIANDARVRVWEWEDPQYFVEDYEPFFFETELLGDGAFDVPVDRQGEFRVWASARGECSSDVVELKLNPRNPVAEVEIVLPEARWIAGRVLDHEGKPVARAELTAFVDVERFGDPLPDGLTSVECWGRPETRTGTDGTFRLHPVHPRVVAYVLQCRPVVRGYRVIRDVDGLFRGVRLSSLVEVPRVAPGSEGVLISVGDHVDTEARAELRVTTNGGAEPPPGLRYELRHIGPRGSLYTRRPVNGSPDVDGYIPIPDLLSGARYEVRLRERYLAEEVRSDSFVALVGIQQVHLVIPFTVEAEIEVRDARGEPALFVSLQVYAPAEGGTKRRHIFGRLGLSDWPVRFPVLPGTYRVEAVGAQNSRVTGELIVEELPVRLVLNLSR